MAVAIENLTRYYGARKALNGVSFDVREGEIFGLLGPNGGGKTTLLQILCTLLPPSSGRATIFGLDVAQEPQRVRRRIGVVFQSRNVDGKLTSEENLWHQGHLYGMRGQKLKERIQQLLELFGLADRKKDLVETLSGGMRRRLELAKGLLHYPGLLLLDEPSAGLDPGARRSLWQYLSLLRSQDSVTILLTTHLLEEAERCDRLAILHQGQLVATGSPDALKKEIGGEVVVLEALNPTTLAEQIRKQLSIEASVVGGKVRFEHPRGHELIPQLVETFPGEIHSARVSQPTLEDVFLRRTGHPFWEDSGRES